MPFHPVETLHRYVQDVGLKNTKQRDVIVEDFFARNAHVSADEILESVRKKDPKISLATVYRTLKVMQDCGLARSHHFGDGHARFEPNTDTQAHHDHLICKSCGAIVEFFDEKLEAYKLSIAKRYGFVMTEHKMELYGTCAKCSV